MEKTIENKARFFALYWGQNVLTSQKHQHEELRYKISFNIKPISESHFLELKPLSSISDEDAIAVSKLCVYGNDTRIENIKKYGRIYAMKSALINDYLRSKGYALPWMGLSVEQLINYGWIKLKSK